MFQHRSVRLGFFLVILYFILSLSRSAYTLWQKENVVIEEERKAEVLKRQNIALQQNYETVQGSFYIEHEARQKLNVSKEGDYVLIMPTISPIPLVTEAPQPEHWQEWMALFWPKAH